MLRHLQTVAVIARGTFTQLVRMKVFYFLAVFALLLFLVGLAFGQLSPEGELKALKDVAFFVMASFANLMAIGATAVLIPRDLEDRTLYTILCKPVPRWTYLVGKWLGVVCLIAASIMVMDLLSVATIKSREAALVDQVVADLIATGQIADTAEDTLAQAREIVARQGATWALQGAVLGILLKAAVLAAAALLLSCIATSSLFTILAGACLLVIGDLQGLARDFYLASQGGPAASTAAYIFSLIFPDLGTFNVIDAAIKGTGLTLAAVGKMLGMAAFYCALYIGCANLLFADKEF